ncbi:MAG: hypothetical protein EAZ85_03135 [Bacteroidetes bacterium]|nr:MAG: hypothetical protein EAZ85_03135 [Bacteroidota bacterium]TAG85966.1 MAG: hypothetical protein EAZ20_13775 [Bacteroidota bacterium]
MILFLYQTQKIKYDINLIIFCIAEFTSPKTTLLFFNAPDLTLMMMQKCKMILTIGHKQF